ncbi:MAG: hypothetical protein GX459_07295 [Bacteroidales bacterium]|nr:hypothetical protein [Bacteroidales bacterium]
MRVYLLTAFYAGFVALYAQTLMLRTALTLFDGNELVAGIFLALWMLLTALGARVKLYPTRFRLIMVSLVLACWLPLAEKLAPMAFTRYFPSGSMPALYQSSMFMLVWIAPVCLCSGILFSMLIKLKPAPKIYAYETLGALTGGIASILLPLALPASAYHSWIPAMIWPLILLFLVNRNSWKIVLGTGWTIIILLALQQKVPTHASQWETPHGRLRRVVYEGDTTFWLGSFMLPSVQYKPEESAQIHFALMDAPPRPRILLIGPLNISLFEDAIKYKPASIVWIDTSPFITRLILKQSKHKLPPEIKVLPLSFQRLLNLEEHFDAVVVMNGEPASLEASRWLSREFAGISKSLLLSEGMVCLNLPPLANYYSSSLLSVYATTLEAYRQHFRYTRFLVNYPAVFLASNHPLDFRISIGLYKAAQYSDYINPWFIDSLELSRRSAQLTGNLPTNTPPTTFNRPYALAVFQGYWINLNQSKLYLLIAGLIMLSWLPLRKGSKYKIEMFGVSFWAASVQIILLFLVQTFTGKIYLSAGLLFACFMAGLSMGTLIHTHLPTTIRHAVLGMIGVSLGAFAPFEIFKWAVFAEIFYHIWAGLFVLFAGYITGALYRQLVSLPDSSASSLYSADLAGGAAGSLITALLLVPLIGIPLTLGLLIFIGIVFLLFVKGKNAKCNA